MCGIWFSHEGSLHSITHAVVFLLVHDNMEFRDLTKAIFTLQSSLDAKLISLVFKFNIIKITTIGHL